MPTMTERPETNTSSIPKRRV